MDETVFPLLRDWKLMHTFGNGNEECIEKFCFATSAMEKESSGADFEGCETSPNEMVISSQTAHSIPAHIGTSVRQGKKKGWDIKLNCLPRKYRGSVSDTSKIGVLI